jgi:hypothetical protein
MSIDIASGFRMIVTPVPFRIMRERLLPSETIDTAVAFTVFTWPFW